MDREKLFEEFINECKSNKQICGSGNPNANILLIGQEHYSEVPIKNNDEKWENYLNDNWNYCSVDNPWVTKDISNTNWLKFQNTSNTWLNYQKLIDGALPNRQKRMVRGKRDFEFDAFTTELNNEAKPSNRSENGNETVELKKRIANRLEVLKESCFIQSFPVIVLACGPYICNQGEGESRQIDKTFGVEFDKTNGRITTENGYWFCTHHNTTDTEYFKAGEKLVIHTRQLSRFYKKDDLTDKIARKINDHLYKLGLL